ncbi:VWA domain-containing protein [Brevibacillus fluminis]|uniref:VWA domain-containing protein n=1 Tax=Brevibacillus fluminis TaxID=511487 RepID=A0A3M8CVU4_9BACL|nr:VWA domain-containing protein [Brevibacillus fluminis]RNB79629.1 VWA domain-containing protein [Brevibacillus fluminis]
MGISFQQPYLLLLLLPALYMVYHWWRQQKRMAQARRIWIAGVRTAMFCLLILAVAGTQLVHPVKAETVVFVIDRSASMKDDSRATAFLAEAVKQKRSEDLYGVVAVGGDAAVDQPLTTKDELQALGVQVNRNATNLAEGIRLAAGMIPSQARGKIVLVTDGLATGGDVEKEVKLAAEREIAWEAVLMQQPQGDEVLVSSVQVPDRLYAGEEFPIKVDVDSTVATKATLRLYEGNREAGKQTVQVEKGKNRFVFAQKAVDKGFHRYRVEVEAERDTLKVNNQAHAFSQVAGSPSLLIVEGQPGAARNLVNALQAGSIQAVVKDPALLPKELDDYKQYAGVVLANVDATKIGDDDMERIRTAVRDLGLGLIMTGGQDSFGMGGWFHTPIEEALPVYMDLRGKEQQPSLGLELVIDKSGSMSGDGRGADKMELAKEAAIRATEMLTEKDQIGVIAFDGSPWTVVEPQPVKDPQTIRQKIGSIYADGGTDIFPALQMAYDEIKKMKAQRKHIILLTDGQSGRDDDYMGLLQQMTGENITVTTVAVGDDADTTLLEDIAQWGKGRYYLSTDPTSIPKIFSKETALASRTFIVEQPQVPALTGASDWTTLRQGLPPLRAYVATTAKQTAEQVLMSQDDDPILARWQYGLGRAVAWTSDLDGKWAPDWVNWAGNSRLWNEIVAWTLPQINEGQWRTETQLDGTTGKLTVTLPKGALLPQELEAVVLDSQMKRQAIRVQPTGPNELQGSFEVGDPGSYLIQIVEKSSGKAISSQTTGLTVSYSPEFGLPQDGEQRLKEWLAGTGGTLIGDPGDVFTGKLPAKWEKQPITEWLLVLAALLWPVDVAGRRLQLPDRFWQRLAGLLRLRQTEVASAPPVTEGGAVLERLGGVKRRTRDEQVTAAAAGTALEGMRKQQDEKRKAALVSPKEAAPTSAAKQSTASSERKPQQGASQGQAGEAFNRLLAAKQRKQK